MKTSTRFCESAANGINLQIEPETDEEEELLRSLWKLGKPEIRPPCGAKGSGAFRIHWSFARVRRETVLGDAWYSPDWKGDIEILINGEEQERNVYLAREDLEAMLASYETKPVGADEEESE